MFVTLIFFAFGDDGPDAENRRCGRLRAFRMSKTIGEHEREAILKFKCGSTTQDQVPWKQLFKSKDVLVLSFSWFLAYIYSELRSLCFVIAKFSHVSTNGAATNCPVSCQSSSTICDQTENSNDCSCHAITNDRFIYHRQVSRQIHILYCSKVFFCSALRWCLTLWRGFYPEYL